MHQQPKRSVGKIENFNANLKIKKTYRYIFSYLWVKYEKDKKYNAMQDQSKIIVTTKSIFPQAERQICFFLRTLNWKMYGSKNTF